MGIAENIAKLKTELGEHVTLVAVSKYSSNDEVNEAYDAGQRDFGENKAQDLDRRRGDIPDDVRWHFIGHLQRNKVKYIASYVHLIHSVDSLRLLREIDKQARKAERTIPVLLQMHIAKEESKFGLDEGELMEILHAPDLPELKHVRIEGLMGMATNTDDQEVVRSEFNSLRDLFERVGQEIEIPNVEMKTLSMGMTNDYPIALDCGTNMIRIGSAIFKN
jgi:hypothetical protein